jgi:protein tyrosine phosphatase
MLDEDAARVYAKRTDDFSCAVAPLNFQKNRYGNILPCTCTTSSSRRVRALLRTQRLTDRPTDNQNRVKLAVADDQSDYVNASYVKVPLPCFLLSRILCCLSSI